jgi:SET domain-containing protein
VHGIGLFACEPISQGTAVWRFMPGYDQEFTSEQITVVPQHVQDWFKHYSYLDFHLGTYILCFDDARFINHSQEPTIRPDYTNDRYGIDLATRNISAGEEITTDYRLFDQGILNGEI